jgi:hypothetical protein
MSNTPKNDSILSAVAHFNVLSTPTSILMPATAKADAEAVTKTANSGKSETLATISTAIGARQLDASPVTVLHSHLIGVQELGLVLSEVNPANAALIGEKLRDMSQLFLTATPESLATAKADRERASDLYDSLMKSTGSIN